MSFFQWLIVVGLAAVVLQLFYAVKAVLAVGQILEGDEKGRWDRADARASLIAAGCTPEAEDKEDIPLSAVDRIAVELQKISRGVAELIECQEAWAKERAEALARLREHKQEPDSPEEAQE